jgi:hypothetical protein
MLIGHNDNESALDMCVMIWLLLLYLLVIFIYF